MRGKGRAAGIRFCGHKWVVPPGDAAAACSTCRGRGSAVACQAPGCRAWPAAWSPGATGGQYQHQSLLPWGIGDRLKVGSFSGLLVRSRGVEQQCSMSQFAPGSDERNPELGGQQTAFRLFECGRARGNFSHSRYFLLVFFDASFTKSRLLII